MSVLDWARQLEDALPLRMPLDRGRIPGAAFRQEYLRTSFPPDTARSLQKIAKRERVSLFSVLLAGYQLMLSRWGGQEDVLILAPLSTGGGQPTSRNTSRVVPLRSLVRGRMTFSQLLHHVHAVVAHACASQGSLPLGTQAALAARSHRVWFSFGHERTRSASSSVTPAEPCASRGEPDLSLELYLDSGALEGVLAYAADLFDAATAKRMERSLVTLITAAVRRPHIPVARLASGSGPRFVHTLIAERCAEMADAVAACAADESLTYRQLEIRSNQLAQRLTDLGVGPDSVVALCLERSAKVLIGMLGVLKAGGAFLPVDPTLPAEQRDYLLVDSGAVAVVTQSSCAPAHGKVPACVFLDWEAHELASYPIRAPAVDIAEENLAYVVYESELAARPRGVMIRHAALLNRVMSQIEALKCDATRQGLASNELAFDASLLQMLPTLAVGGQLA